ncbi:hypothetical protein EOD42_22345 [Rhodovarius crocodyli]|uniref:Uncharacterized protein n=1 Tax=Rhodovarius crocodyli TaxID=1979269 RepID=A0A437M147_9PROT|nr:hypothetical protein [Rhodovarius crocodyli]RVT91398.1 hypothetical protein EOD42_22345 [Rhodovarius crocodyli]
MIEQTLAELRAAGWRLNNLYEHDNGQWVANARRPAADGGTDIDFARGDCAVEALRTLTAKLGMAQHAPAFHVPAVAAVSPHPQRPASPAPPAPPAPGAIAQGELF